MDIEQTITGAINGRFVVEITYTDAKGNRSRRMTEPYELKGDKYFGYCLTKNSIRSFSIRSISKAVITDKNYTPRF